MKNGSISFFVVENCRVGSFFYGSQNRPADDESKELLFFLALSQVKQIIM